MAFAGNLLWILFGGWLVAFGWAIGGCILMVTVIGIPFGFAAFRIAGFVLWPFGRELVDARLLGEKRIAGTGLVNFIWILLAGLWLAISHALSGAALCLTIVGIPVALIHFKLAEACFAPLGKRIVNKHLAFAAHQRAAQEQLAARMGHQPIGTAAIEEGAVWYIRGVDKTPAGPFTAEELAHSLGTGRLDAKAICWREGMA